MWSDHIWPIRLIGIIFSKSANADLLHFEPLSADSDNVLIILCIPKNFPMNWTRERVPLKTNFCEYKSKVLHPIIKPPHGLMGKPDHSPSPADSHKSHHASLSERSACRVWVFVLIPVSGRTDSNWNSRIRVCLCVFQVTGESRSPWAAVTVGRDVSSRGNETQC